MNLLQLAVAFAVGPSMACVGAAGAAEPDRGAFLAKQTIDCRGCDLAGANLDRRDLTGADLSGAKLTGATFARTAAARGEPVRRRSAGADFKRHDLTGANLSAANLEGATFHRAVLRGANLSGANLTRANLKLDHSDRGQPCNTQRWFRRCCSKPKRAARFHRGRPQRGADGQCQAHGREARWRRPHLYRPVGGQADQCEPSQGDVDGYQPACRHPAAGRPERRRRRSHDPSPRPACAAPF